MVVEYIRYALPEERRSAFEAAYGIAQAQLRLSEDCTGFELTQCVEDPSQYILRITWTSAEAHLSGFRKGPHFPLFLAQIRPFVDAIQEMRHYTQLPVRSDLSVFESAGGETSFSALATTMHDRMAKDDLLSTWFGNASPSHVPSLTKWMIEVFGGPPVYTETYGDLSHILAKHGGLVIPEDKRARFASIAVDAATEVWPDRPDIVRVISRYVEWGTRVAVENSLPGHTADPSAGVPTWGWDD